MMSHRRRLGQPHKQASHTKNYAVGLEISCPGGVYYWAPEIPSAIRFSRPYAEQM
jgi:hypothetical protein